jgi:hypothetical protein
MIYPYQNQPEQADTITGMLPGISGITASR